MSLRLNGLTKEYIIERAGIILFLEVDLEKALKLEWINQRVIIECEEALEYREVREIILRCYAS